MTRPIPEPSPAALAKALARQQSDLERFPEGAVVRITQHVTSLMGDDMVSMRAGGLWVVVRAVPGMATLVNPRDGRKAYVGQDTLKQCAEVVT
jgi:hypothetical protein